MIKFSSSFTIDFDTRAKLLMAFGLNRQSAMELARRSAKLGYWDDLSYAGSIVQEMSNAEALFFSIERDNLSKARKNRLLRKLMKLAESYPEVSDAMDETVKSLKEIDSREFYDPDINLIASAASLAATLARLSYHGKELNDQARSGELMDIIAKAGIFIESGMLKSADKHTQLKTMVEFQGIIMELTDFLFEVTDHVRDKSNHLLGIELAKAVDCLTDNLVKNSPYQEYAIRLKEFRFQYKLQDTSREYWFMGKIFMAIRSRHPKVRFYTTSATQDKYRIQDRTHILPRMEKIGPDWAYLSEMPYVNPSTEDEGEYIIIYELSLDHKFNLPVSSFEPENHPFIVIRDNTEVIEIKEFIYVAGKLVLVHDYW